MMEHKHGVAYHLPPNDTTKMEAFYSKLQGFAVGERAFCGGGELGMQYSEEGVMSVRAQRDKCMHSGNGTQPIE